MNWFKLCLWLSAWAFWLWLGIGLHRELPRDLGPVVCRALPLAENEYPFGWSEKDVIATEVYCGDWFEGRKRYRRWNTVTRGLISDSEGPAVELTQLGRPPLPRFTAANQGVVVARMSGGRNLVFDLRTGHSETVGEAQSWPWQIHALRPWVSFTDDGKEDGRPGAFVYDIETRSKVFERRLPEKVRVGDANFVAGSDDLVVSVVRLEETGASKSQSLERWNIPTGRQVSTCELPGSYWTMSRPSTNGLVVCRRPTGDADRFDAIDSRTGVPVFTWRTIRDFAKYWSPYAMIAEDELEGVLSADGATLLLNGRLVSLPLGTELWNANGQRHRFDRKASGEVLRVEEDWGTLIGLNADSEWSTVAFRDPATGRLRERVWSMHPNLIENEISQFGVDRLGNVYSLTLFRNYHLLALCQTILALPLIFLWAVLRWRRRRKMAIASA